MLGDLRRALRPNSSKQQPYSVFYDGACGLCTGTVAKMQRADVLGRIRYVDVVHDWETIAERHPGLDPDACLKDLHVVTPDGRVLIGFDGYRALAWVIPAAWPILPLLYLPGARAIGWRVYRRIADRRSRTVCMPGRNAPRAAPRRAGRGPLEP